MLFANAAIVIDDFPTYAACANARRQGKAGGATWSDIGRLFHVLSSHFHSLEVHIERSGVGHLQVIAIALPNNVVSHIFWAAFHPLRAINQLDARLNGNLGRDADLVVMVDCQIPADDLVVHFF